MKVLITGGGGFLGLHVAKYFAAKGDKVYILDIHKPEMREYPKNTIFFNADIRNLKLLHKIFKEAKPDFIVHAAAALPLWSAKDIMEINVKGTGNILEASKKVRAKRVIYISSTAVYGVPIKHPIEEGDSRVGVGPYGQSKIDAEDLCFKYIKSGLNVTIIRPKTFLGTHRLGVFEILFDWVHDGKRIPLIGNGKNRYQLLEVDDLANAIYLFTRKNSKKFNTAYNIGAKDFSTIRGDFDIFFKTIKSKSRILATPAPIVKRALWVFEKLKLSPLYQWVYDTADKDSFVSIDKLTKALDWHPRHSNSDALIKAYRWYFKNYKEIKSRGTGTTHTVGWKQGILALVKKVM